MRLRAAVLCASLLIAASPSHANGRFPLSQRLFQDQGNPGRLFLSATFGVLVSDDGGRSWYHVCERAFFPEVRETDPLLELMVDGSVLAGLVQPLSISSDCGCSWQPVLATSPDDWVIDIAKAGGDAVVAVVRSSVLPPDGGLAVVSYRLERSTDRGRTFSKVSDFPSRILFNTVDVALADPSRVYVSAMLSPNADAGIVSATPALLVSDDGGMSWEVRPIAGATGADQPYIAAVHPTNRDVVFVRTDAWVPNDETGLDEASDALFYSEDGGRSFREVLRKRGKLFGFALAPDSSAVLAGFGDPVQATRATYSEDLGIYRASATELTFTLALNASVSCLTWNASGLYACLEERDPALPAPFAIGLSADGSVPTTLAGFTPLLRFADVRGPFACLAATCLDDWQTMNAEMPPVCARLGASCAVDPAMNAVACVASGGAAGTGAAGSSGASMGGASAGSSQGGAGSGAAAGAAGATAATAGMNGTAGKPTAREPSRACGCRAPGRRGVDGAFATTALLVALAVGRRTLRYRQRHTCEFRRSLKIPKAD